MYTAQSASAAQLPPVFAKVISSVNGTPGALLVEMPKLLRMSLRTTPLCSSTLERLPLALLLPSEGNGPLVSSGCATQLPEPAPLPLPPAPMPESAATPSSPSQAASSSAALPPIIQRSN